MAVMSKKKDKAMEKKEMKKDMGQDKQLLKTHMKEMKKKGKC